jgi:large subunit ribosomal protein L29
MKMNEFRVLDEAEVGRRLRDLQEELFNLRFQYATRQLTNHARIQVVRRDIARIKTLLRERALDAEVA